MGNTCNKPEDQVSRTVIPHHKRKGPTMVSYDFDSSRGQIRATRDLNAEPLPEPQEEGKRVPETKKLGKRR